MNWSIARLPIRGPIFDGAIRAYGEAFRLPPYSDPDRGREVRQRLIDTHHRRPGFSGFVALDSNGEVIGVTYGYRSIPGQWWHDAVCGVLPHDSRRQWFADTFELVEIAVAPSRQGQGVGAALIDVLLYDRPEANCALSTRTDSEAHHLYRRLGFEEITTIRFAPGGAEFFVLGKRLRAEKGT